MPRVLAGLFLCLLGAGLAASGLFFGWMSGFASPLDREWVLVLSAGAVLVGIGAMVGGVVLWYRRLPRSVEQAAAPDGGRKAGRGR